MGRLAGRSALIVAVAGTLAVAACSKNEEAKPAGDTESKTQVEAQGKSTADGPKAKPAKAASAFELTIKASNGMSWSQDSEAATLRKATGDYWDLKGKGWAFRLMASKLDDPKATESEAINFNNTYLHFETEIGGNKQMIACKPDRKQPKGIVKRTKLTDDVVEGTFEFEAPGCSDYMSGKPVEYDKLPLTIKGSFSLPLTGS